MLRKLRAAILKDPKPETASSAAFGPAFFDVSTSTNPSWNKSQRGLRVTVKRDAIIGPGTRIFAMGSCFAVEIRSALRDRGYDVYPKYQAIQFDIASQRIGKLPVRDNINHYDTYVIRQEIERALSQTPYNADGFWSLRKHPLRNDHGWREVWQDPYRLKVYASSLDCLNDLNAKITATVAEGLQAADVIIITLGLTECWRNRSNGLFICRGPDSAEDEIATKLEFHSSSFADNYENLSSVINDIKGRYPEKRIVITVSPVALGSTQTNQDVVVANLHSKSTLRAVAGQIIRDWPDVIYWPSFEFASRHDIYSEDGRHVTKAAVNQIVAAFLEAHEKN